IFTFSKGVADLNGAVVMQSDDIAGYSLFYSVPITRHKSNSIRNSDIFRQADVPHLHTLAVHPRADSHESNTVAMFGVHVCLNLKDKATELIFTRFNNPLFRRPAARRRCPLNKTIQHFTDTEVAQCCSKKYRRHAPGKIFIDVKLMGSTAYKFNFFPNLSSVTT